MIPTDKLPDIAGAYVLVIDVAKPLNIKVMKRALRLAPGCYLYCGSARGPGGISARVKRHIRKEKPVRWHVDQLTIRATIRNVIVAPGGTECALFEKLSALPGAEVPIPGFGSSDCRQCPSHMLYIPGGHAALQNIALKRDEVLL
jgi:Uri superfamily endonuclease